MSKKSKQLAREKKLVEEGKVRQDKYNKMLDLTKCGHIDSMSKVMISARDKWYYSKPSK